MIITFLGHSSLTNCDELSEQVKKVIMENTKNDEKIVFYCGGYGDFDHLCAKVCRSVKEKQRNVEVIFVTPYITESQQKKLKYLETANLYDAIVYPPLEKVPLRFAISRRNEWMINQADLIIAYVKYSYGGAYKALQYANKKKKHIINLAK